MILNIGLRRTTYVLCVILGFAPAIASAQLAGGLQFPGPGLSAQTSTLSCSGGTVTTVGSNQINTFNSSGTLTCTGTGTAAFFLCGGGGGGGPGVAGSTNGGGGGAGGVLIQSVSLSAGTFPITIGAGGASNTNGSNSSFGSIATATGGGHGGSSPVNGAAGGSGGGGAGNTTTAGTGGAATSGQGNNGGAGSNVSPFPSGGGGGANAGAVGGTGTGSASGAGGSGIQSLISGSLVNRAGGGGGGGTAPGAGGLGGGGAGASSGAGTAGAANSCGGGGGAVNTGSPAGGAGGSGVFIISTPAATSPSIGTPVSLGTNSGATSTFNLVTSAAIVAGDLVVVPVGTISSTGAAVTVTNVTDQSLNTYVRATGETLGAQDAELWFCVNCRAMASGDEITVTLSTAPASVFVSAARIPGGLSALDVAPAGIGSTTATPTISTGALASSNQEIVFGALFINGTPTVTEGPGFSTISNNTSGETLHLGFKIATSTGSVTYAPTESASNSNVIMTAAFK